MTEQPDQTGVPAEVRTQTAIAHEQVYPAVLGARWADAAAPARRVLSLLDGYPNATQAWHFCVELAWAHFAVGMGAKSAGRLDEAIAHLTRAIEVLPSGPQAGRIPLEARYQRALIYFEKADLRRSIDGLRGVLCAMKAYDPHVSKSVVFLNLGRVLERRGGSEDRVDAIRNYAESIRSQPVETPVEQWTHEAYAGIVRCCFAGSPAEARPFWTCWMQGWRRVWLIGLVCTALSLFASAVYHVAHGEVQYAWSLVALAVLPLLVILLPALRKASGPGWSIEMQDRPTSLGFAFDLKRPGDGD